jgi:hypothetical protein
MSYANIPAIFAAVYSTDASNEQFFSLKDASGNLMPAAYLKEALAFVGANSVNELASIISVVTTTDIELELHE